MLPLPAGREASSGVAASVYVRHRPERTLLYQLVENYCPTLKAHLAAQGTTLLGYVEREFQAYLKCRHLEHGFLRVRCETYQTVDTFGLLAMNGSGFGSRATTVVDGFASRLTVGLNALLTIGSTSFTGGFGSFDVTHGGRLRHNGGATGRISVNELGPLGLSNRM